MDPTKKRGRLAIVVGVLALSAMSVACQRTAEDPDRARCKQEMESFYRRARASQTIGCTFTGGEADGLFALAAQVKSSNDPYCKLVRDKVQEIEQCRAASDKVAAEAQKDITRLRTSELGESPAEWSNPNKPNPPPVAVPDSAISTLKK